MCSELDPLRVEMVVMDDGSIRPYQCCHGRFVKFENVVQLVTSLAAETGELRSDDDGDWFAVPDSKLEEFDDRMAAIEGKDCEECPEEFDDFVAFSGAFLIDRPDDVKVIIPRKVVGGC